MKDAYSFNADDASLDDTYQDMAQGLPQRVPAMRASGADGRGGQRGHRRQGLTRVLLPTETGEDTVITCSGCDYVANAEKAQGIYPPVEREAEEALLGGRDPRHQDHRGAGRVPKAFRSQRP